MLIVNLFLTAALSLFSVLLGITRERRWPLILVIVVIIMVLSFSDSDDNHRVHELTLRPKTPETNAHELPSLEQAFRSWIAARRDRDQFVDRNYPIYIVAAQGGGIYAAYHAGMFLAAVQDRYPTFAQHLFAISAVSGGSLGASAFSSLIKEHEELKDADNSGTWYWQKAREFLSQDFLSEVTAAALFLDAPARLLPCWGFYCPGERLSRARALEQSIEDAWGSVFSSGQSPNPFTMDIRQFWDPRKDSPALLLNTTEVETGERVVVAPFSLADESTPGLFSLEDRSPDLHIPLSTGVSLSARFPWLTPAGSYTANTSHGVEKRRLVDGGYFENSGVATALDLITRLRKCSPTATSDCSPKAKFILIALVGPQGANVTDAPRHSFNELITPLRALDSTRLARGRLAVEQAQLYLDRLRCPDVVAEVQFDCGLNGTMRELFLATGNVRVPLGWVLSQHSRAAIECSFGIPELCHNAQENATTEKYRRHNSQLITVIGKELQFGR